MKAKFFRIFFAKILFLVLSFQLHAADCDPILVFKNLRTGNNFLPYTVNGLDHSRLDLVTDFVNQQTTRTGRTPNEVIAALKEIKPGNYNVAQIQTKIDQKLIGTTTRGKASGVRRVAQGGSSHVRTQTAPTLTDASQRTQTYVSPQESLPSTLDGPEALPRTLDASDSQVSEMRRGGNRSPPAQKRTRKLPPDHIDFERGNQLLTSHHSMSKISPETHVSQVDLPPGVDLTSPIDINFPGLKLDFDLIDQNKTYLRSSEFNAIEGGKYKLAPRNPRVKDDIGTELSSGAFKSTYVTKDGKHVVKILKGPDPKTMTAAEILHHKRKMMQALRRELAIQEFLEKVAQRYIKAGIEPPFKVLPIIKDPELLKRGIIIQQTASGTSLDSINRSQFNRLSREATGQISTRTKGRVLQSEVEEYLPRAKEMMAIFNRFVPSIEKSVLDNSGLVIAGKVNSINPQGAMQKRVVKMPIDYGDGFRNLAFNPKGKPPFEFYDW